MRRILVFALLSLAPLALLGAEDEPPDVGKAYQKQIDRAWKKASEGESPANACAAIKGKVSRLLGGSHDDDVMSEARAALDTCDVTLLRLDDPQRVTFEVRRGETRCTTGRMSFAAPVAALDRHEVEPS